MMQRSVLLVQLGPMVLPIVTLVFPYSFNVNYWKGKRVHTFSRKQIMFGYFLRYDEDSLV